MAPFWVRSARIYLLESPDTAHDFYRQALRWTLDANRYEAAVELLRLNAQTQLLNEQYFDAEKTYLYALEIATSQGNEQLNVDIRIDLLSLYTNIAQFRSASTQLTLLESLPLSTLQRIRLLGVHAEMNLRDGHYIQAATLLLEGRKISQQIRRWDLAIDAALSAIEALHVGDRAADAKSLWLALREEATQSNREDRWMAIGKLLRLDERSADSVAMETPDSPDSPAEDNR